MTNDQYIESVLARHALKARPFVALARLVILPKLREWAGVYLNRLAFTGSMAKGTGVSGATDLDVFISLRPNTPLTLGDIYERLFRWSERSHWLPRRQNVSIGISFLGVKIDLVPGKLQEGYTLYHSLWRRKAQAWTQSAPEIHVNKVIGSGRSREIRAMKIWRKNHNLDFPSFYLELTVMAALSGCGWNLESNVQRALGYIADNLGTATVRDPANTNNFISDDLTQAEKKVIAAQAEASFNERSWLYTLW